MRAAYGWVITILSARKSLPVRTCIILYNGDGPTGWGVCWWLAFPANDTRVCKNWEKLPQSDETPLLRYTLDRNVRDDTARGTRRGRHSRGSLWPWIDVQKILMAEIAPRNCLNYHLTQIKIIFFFFFYKFSKYYLYFKFLFWSRHWKLH